MAGRIRDEDVTLIKERVNIAEVIGEQVTLRNAGSGNLRGLCPFHDEKTPSFNVRPAVGAYHCFGCGEGGDAISFVMKIDHLSFAEAVERLAAKAGVQLRYEEGGTVPGRQVGPRKRLIDAHQAAAQFFAEQLDSDEAAIGRRFLDERGFDQEAARRFGVGYAPRGWDVLVRHLRGRGFTEKELITGGLASQGQRGPIDRFRERLLWPIRDLSGDVIGFGARRLREDDNGPKYLNTPETPIYRKSSLLYGLDLAKKTIARRMEAVIVEGYTDVMACHLSGVETAIATCGTAFGEEHIKVLRRLLMDQNEFRGEVIFTFDGDEAGQKAALKAFEDDQKFVTRTFVAVEPGGMDPCELRQLKGDEAVRELVARRVPLFEFAIRSILARHNLDTAEGRTAAQRASMALVQKIRDVALRRDYARQLAGWLGLPETDELVAQARGSVSHAARARPSQAQHDRDDPAQLVERESLKLALQEPALAGAAFDALEPQLFTSVPCAAVHAAIVAAGGTSAGIAGEPWVARVREHAADEATRSLVTELAVEPIRSDDDADARYADALLTRLEELAVTRRIALLKGQLQRLNPVEQSEQYNRMFGSLVALEQRRRQLRERSIGAL